MSETGPGGYAYLPQEMMFVGTLKQALVAMQEELTWLSSDNHTIYHAAPLDDEGLHYEAIGQMPMEEFAGKYNTWIFKSDTYLEETREVRACRWVIEPRKMVGAAAVGSMEIEEDTDTGRQLLAALKDELLDQLGEGRPVEAHDYGLIIHALCDLMPLAEMAMEDRDKKAREFNMMVAGW